MEMTMAAASANREVRIDAGVNRAHCIRYASAKKTATLATMTRTAPLTASLARHRART